MIFLTFREQFKRQAMESTLPIVQFKGLLSGLTATSTRLNARSKTSRIWSYARSGILLPAATRSGMINQRQSTYPNREPVKTNRATFIVRQINVSRTSVYRILRSAISSCSSGKLCKVADHYSFAGVLALSQSRASLGATANKIISPSSGRPLPTAWINASM